METLKREKEMHVTIFNALATFISSFNAKNFLSFAANVGCGNFLCAPSFLRQGASFFIVSQHTHTHVKSDGSAAAAEGSISCLLCLDLQSTYFSFFSSQHVQACLLSCCLAVSCLAVLLSPDC